MGFPTTVPDCTGDNCATKQGTFIIPDMRFICSGIVIGWRVAGERIPGGNINSALIIWRERSTTSEPGTYYDNIDRIELGDCAGQRVQTGMNNVYECILNQDGRVSVLPGDIIGIEIPGQANGKFRLYFDSSSGPTNYILDSWAPQTINLNDSAVLDQLVPQISLTVKVSATQITTTELIDASTITSGPTSTEAESIATSDHTTEMTDGSTTTNQPSPAEVVPTTMNGGSSVGVIVGSLIGVIMLVSLLSTVAILVLVVAYQSRKYKRDIMRERETRIDRSQNGNIMVDIETKPNDSYIPTFRQTLIEGNAIYGWGENRVSDDGYSTIAQSTSDSTRGNAQESVTEQNEENYYEFID